MSKSQSQPGQTESPKSIAIAGATGRIGAPLTLRLAETGIPLIALSRDAKAAKVPPGVTSSTIDFGQPAQMTETLRNVDRLFISQGTSPNQADNEIALIDAAVAAGVRHVVKISALGPPSRLHPFDWHMQIEAHLAVQPIGYTVLRPGPYVDILQRASKAVVAGNWGGAAGSGRVNFIDTRDVADVAFTVLVEDLDPTVQRAFHLTGAHSWTMQQIADEIARLTDRPVAYERRSPTEQRAFLVASGLPEPTADLLVGLDRVFHDSILAEGTATVEQLTGHPPRSVSEWLAERIDAFRP